MFSTLKPKTALFIDYSNIFYAKYTVWWHFDIENLLEYCKTDSNIVFVWVYGAYDPKNLNQYNWVELMKHNFNDPKYLIYFKPLESHGSKNKWNVDTEMWYDLAEYKSLYEHMVLMSWDGDFAHPLKKLIGEWKTITISSTRWHISGLINLSQEFPTQCRFLDFNITHTESIELRHIIKNSRKWLAIDPALQKFLSTASKWDIQDLVDFIDHRNRGIYYTKKAIFLGITDKNNFPLYKNIARWQIEEKDLLVKYLKQILAS